MTGFLGTEAPWTSDIALLLEIAILIILFTSRFRFARSKKFVKHGYAMTSAVILHAATILLVMVPSFTLYVPSLGSLSAVWLIILFVHIPAGLIAWIIGLFLVATWRFRSEAEMTCMKRSRLMRPLFWLWVFALILGIALYAHYTIP